jgi:hypothetical protein
MKVMRGVGVVTIVLIFVLTLVINWPLSGVAGVLEREDVRLNGVSGTLPDGAIGRIALSAEGWPLGLGPVKWRLVWPLGVRLQLGQAPTAWEVEGEWRGRSSHWTITGGDMAALDLSRLPFAIDARWEGALNLTLAGAHCVVSEGALTAAPIELLAPTPIALGQGRLRLDCSTGTPRLRIDIEDGEALNLTISLALAASGTGEVKGVIAPAHPLAQWRQLLQPGASGEQIDAHLRW